MWSRQSICIPFEETSDFDGVCGALFIGGFGCEANGNALFDSVELPTGLELDIGV